VVHAGLCGLALLLLAALWARLRPVMREQAAAARCRDPVLMLLTDATVRTAASGDSSGTSGSGGQGGVVLVAGSLHTTPVLRPGPLQTAYRPLVDNAPDGP
jgi:hypothetical protein